MNNYSTVFGPSSVLLPPFAADPCRMKRWAVIACDQFTSEPEYWARCCALIGEEPSALGYFMPEAYLGTEEEEKQAARIRENMAAFDSVEMRAVDGFVRLERTMPDGSVRRGIVGALDLEAYSYESGSESPVRATEATVLERIPPRRRVRAQAVIELPHILVLADDRTGLFDGAQTLPGSLLYDFDLMEGGGHIRGYAVAGQSAESLRRIVRTYEESRGKLVYAVGDGNHSLAAAKAHWENVKRETGDMTHPARYALCEITPLADASLRFEPIYRIVKRCDPEDLLRKLRLVTAEADGQGQEIAVLASGREERLRFADPAHALTVGTLQAFLDGYVSSHAGTVCDYIHGEDSLRTLAAAPDAVGFLLDGMDKNDLFPYVEAHGTLPRKTFSMGEARSKRYYLECRKIMR